MEEKKIIETGGTIDKGAQMDDWLECRSDESNRTEYEYKYEEDPENMMVKKFKKQKGEFTGIGSNDQASVTIKEPFYYTEILNFPTNEGYHDMLASEDQIVPFGFPTEQAMQNIKNQVKNSVAESRAENQASLTELKR